LQGARYKFTTENANRTNEAIEMKLLEGPFRHFAAHWRFHALAERAARIGFAMEYEFGSRAIAMALSPVFDAIANSMVEAFKRRADQVYGPPAR